MGINGRLLMGDGIWVNLTYLPPEWFDYLNQLWEKYPYLFEVNQMDGPTQKSSIIFWGQQPTVLFPVDTYDRRPLVINQPHQNDLIRPIAEPSRANPEGVFLDDEKIWEPSYGDFEIRLNDYYDRIEEKREAILKYLFSQEYQLGEDYLPERESRPETELQPQSSYQAKSRLA